MNNQLCITIIIIIVMVIIVCIMCYSINNTSTNCNNQQDSFQIPLSVCTPGYSVPGSNAVYCQPGILPSTWSSCAIELPAECVPGMECSWSSCATVIPQECIPGYVGGTWTSCATGSPAVCQPSPVSTWNSCVTQIPGVCQPGLETQWSACATSSTEMTGGQCTGWSSLCIPTITCTGIWGSNCSTNYCGDTSKGLCNKWAPISTQNVCQPGVVSYTNPCATVSQPTCIGGMVNTTDSCGYTIDTCVPGVINQEYSTCAYSTPQECLPGSVCDWSNCLYSTPSECIPGFITGAWTGCISTTEKVVSVPYYVPQNCT